MNVLKSFIRDESGQDMVEYGLLAAFISIAGIVALQAIGPKILVIFNTISTKLSSAPSA